MPTMVDVARLAGVSISTVSHVLNGTRNVEAATRRRVLDAIATTGYRQDALARALRRSRTDSIGLVVSDAGEPAFAEMVHGVEHAVAQRGMTLLLANSAEDAEQERRAVHTLIERRVDGLILARGAESRPDLVATLAGEKTPTVLLDRVFADLPFDQVGADNRESMHRLTTHLIQAGHRRFAVIAGDTRVPTLRERADGFLDAVLRSGLEPSDQTVLEGPDERALGEPFAARMRVAPPPAVIACSTPLAVLALETLAAQGLATPRDVAFATFDGFPHSDLFQPAITTVRQPAFDMGVAAVGLLGERLVAPGASARTVRLKQTIELRESTEAWTGRGLP